MAAAAAAAIIGATIAVAAGTSSAQTTAAKATTPAPPMSAGPWSAGPWSAGPGWAGYAQGPWTPTRSARTEYFHVASTAPSGPGTIIITGVVDAGGAEHPGRAIDDATFADGGFRIDHSAGHPSVSFNADTCVGTISQTGPFSVLDGTGRFSAFTGSGTYVFRALYTTARDATGCTNVMTGYIETIDGTLTLSPSAARAVEAAAG
ncbi:MAG TPA: hypothetical protein VIX15_08340 [Streptosporangiaceae bacterium]